MSKLSEKDESIVNGLFISIGHMKASTGMAFLTNDKKPDNEQLAHIISEFKYKLTEFDAELSRFTRENDYH